MGCQSVCCDIDLEVANVPRSGKDAATQLQTLAAGAENNRNELLPSPPCGSMPKRARKAKTWSVLVNTTIQIDAESLNLFRLRAGFSCQGARKSMFTLSAALLRTERRLSGTYSLSRTYSRFCVPTWGWNSSKNVSA